jgi:hypothetical protein
MEIAMSCWECGIHELFCIVGDVYIGTNILGKY